MANPDRPLLNLRVDAMADGSRLRPARGFFMSNSRARVSEILAKVPEFLGAFEQTGDPYLDLPLFCAVALLESAGSIPDSAVSVVNTARRMISVVINWGIYPHLPKSIHIKFLEDEPQWYESPAPPRLLRPRPEMLDALAAVFASPGLGLIQPLFLQHAISIFYYLAADRIPAILSLQGTEVIVASILGLFPTGLRLTPLLMSVVSERSDSFEALEGSMFPPPMLAKVLAAPPSNSDEDEYYRALFKKSFDAIRSDKGAGLARLIVSRVINSRLSQFLSNFSLDALVNWPNTSTIAPIFWTINKFLFWQDLQKVLLPPIPQRTLFVAVHVTGEIREQALLVLQNFLKETASVDFVQSVVEVASLAPLGLDGFQIVTNDSGVFAFANDADVDLADELAILENMRTLLAESMNVSDVDLVIRRLPAAMQSIHFVSAVLPRFSALAPDLAATLLAFLSRLADFREAAADIARHVVRLAPGLASVPACVASSFLAAEVPELALLALQAGAAPSDPGFDRAALLEDLASPILPLRGRGLFTLRRGVLTPGHPLRDEGAIRSLFPGIESQLGNPDTYVFLNAIQCLEAIAIVFPHLVVETLAAQFPRSDDGLSLTVAQTLMLCVRRNGPGLVHSPDGNLCGFFIRAFARGCAHTSDLVQASSLSNLATLVETLRFGVGPWFADIVRTVGQAWQIHNALQVRRAASYLAYRIVQCLGEGFEEFSRGDLAALCETVKRMKGGEFDDVCQQNARDCYDSLWEICPMLL
jgi:hypothetical protein